MLKVANHLRISKLLWDEDCTKHVDFNTDKLLEGVRNNEALWKKTDKHFKNRLYRTKLWDQLAKDLDCDVSAVPDIRKKWETIKASYVRSKRRLSNGQQKNKDYKYAAQLTFLDEEEDVPEPQITISSVEEGLKVFDDMQTDEVAEDTQSTSRIPQEVCSVRTDSREVLSTSPAISLPRIKDGADRKTINLPELGRNKTSDDIFGEYIAAELKTLQEHVKDEAKLSLMMVIAEAKKK